VSRNLEIVRRLYEALENSERDVYRELTHALIEWQFMEGFPHGGIQIGHEAVFDGTFPALMQDFAEWHVRVEEILDATSAVVGIGHYEARARFTGIGVKAPFAHVFRLREGKIIRVQQFTDTAKLMRALEGKAT
jgi:hypothetical protein